jgi:hypothetical protein
MVQLWSSNCFRPLLKRFCSAIRAACFLLVTSEMVTVTAEAAGSSPVVPAILFRSCRKRMALQGFSVVVFLPQPRRLTFRSTSIRAPEPAI